MIKTIHRSRRPSASGVVSAIGEVGLGICGEIPLSWNTIYTDDPVIENGDIIYTDAALTVPFDGNDLTYRYRKSGGAIQNVQFAISDVGVVSAVVECGGGGESITIEETSVDGCGSYWKVRVHATPLNTKDVSITKTGNGLYAGSSPFSGDVIVISDTVETIDEDKFYLIGIDAAAGNESGSTSISVVVAGESSASLDRSHQDPVINC